MESWIRFGHQADIYYFNGHGIHHNAAVVLSDTKELHMEIKPNEKFNGKDWKFGKNLKVIVFDACSVLDIGNFNSNKMRYNCNSCPGLAWKQKVHLGQKCLLLGYNYAVRFWMGEFIVDQYFDSIFASKLFEKHETMALEWLSFHGRLNVGFQNGRYEHLMGDHACVVYTENHAKPYYYFISFEHDRARKRHYDRIIVRVEIPGVPKYDWNAYPNKTNFGVLYKLLKEKKYRHPKGG